jgi:hypothetical protein
VQRFPRRHGHTASRKKKIIKRTKTMKKGNPSIAIHLPINVTVGRVHSGAIRSRLRVVMLDPRITVDTFAGHGIRKRE